MDPRADGATIYSLPQAFINKRGDAILANMLDDKLSQRLVDMYLAFEPRNSFQGLPPISDAACVSWVRHMIDTGINLIALSFEAGLVGHSALFPVNDRVSEMLAVVSPPFQNIGIGTELTRCAIQLAHELGYDTIQLSVEATNSRARHVYKKCGFDYKHYDHAGEVEMALDLRRYRDVASLRVAEVMNRDVLAIRENESCRNALEVFLSGHIGLLPVVDERGQLLGIISNSDLMLPSQIDRKVGDIFTRQVLTVEKGCTIAKVIQMLQFKKIRGICVVDCHGKLVGIVGPEDILGYYDEHF
jgi:RimJ/RimL family protein N-acetyltransferase